MYTRRELLIIMTALRNVADGNPVVMSHSLRHEVMALHDKVRDEACKTFTR